MVYGSEKHQGMGTYPDQSWSGGVDVLDDHEPAAAFFLYVYAGDMDADHGLIGDRGPGQQEGE